MSTVADVVRAIDAEGSTSWQIADELAALDETDPTTGKPLTLKQIEDRIWHERGVEWKAITLGKYRATARAFPIGSRLPMVTFTVHQELRAHPEKLLKWKPTKSGDVLTVERARQLRGRSSAPKKDPNAWKSQAEKAWKALDNLVENDPAYFIDALERLIKIWTARYPKTIAKSRDLRVV